MKKLVQNELEQEFNKIILTKENDTHLDATDLQLLIDSSTNKIFFHTSLEIKMDVSISIEVIRELKKLKNYKTYVIQFGINPQCSILNLLKIFDIINDIVNEDTEIVYATKKHENHMVGYIEVKIFATY